MGDHYLNGVLLEEPPLGFTEPTEEEVVALNNLQKADMYRQERNALLTESDWTQVSDSTLTDEAKASWVTYRTALRNLPNHSNWPNLEDNDWPTKPS